MTGILVIYFSIIGMLVGAVGMILSKNIIKKILSLGIVETSVNLMYTGISARGGIIPPIISGDFSNANYADPIPQAVIITGIVISFALLCLSLVFAIIIYNKYHTMNVETIEMIFEREEK
ncbi:MULTISPECIES: cation:proton antiporter subunit C [Mesotoga]|jgi:multicomponent Na+:H+ antiporter subunit C|uniref:sodium:proton antiporter n=1 Tax=Mesotoga TaxID=1184396 RepID=UPI0002CBE995|nr:MULTISPECIES: cation:proton antiporter subunit C [Mesotoga]MCB1222476.1 Na+/H+ antiporter subunit C [Mesotoga sp.]MCP5457973.1 Na+/H+ antiporter subunit C [Thermotogota bacterium]CCU85124.1 NADH-ubiquinone oxidoreductase chain 4L [Mesotoga infera]MCP5461191.1 Na+/H+ antiporter subunit C [Thermotogota bacterium]MDK2943843.1 multicomponent Na+:H+ antiporter subunit [Mesotoga sp.]